MQNSLMFETCSGNVEDSGLRRELESLQPKHSWSPSKYDLRLHLLTATSWQRPHRKPMPCYIIMQTLKDQRNLLNMGSIACIVCKLDLDMLMLPRTFHIRELSSHCTTLSTFSHHNQKPRDKMTSQRKVAFVYRPLPQSSLPLREIQQARVLSDENCDNPGLQWSDTMGTVDGINKERTRSTCGGERITWAALFLPTRFWHIIRAGEREKS